MPTAETALERLRAVPRLTVSENAPLSRYTRFGIGGPARLLAETSDEDAFMQAIRVARDRELPLVVIGGGTNLVVSDEGFDGVVLRFTGRRIAGEGAVVEAGAGACLQELVDFTVSRGLAGVETLTGIPGTVGAAVYGNAGAYGHSISERVRTVRFFDGAGPREADGAQCQFDYRESVFKRRKDWVIFSVKLELEPADPEALRETAQAIRQIRDRKFPPTMKCAGSVFKNLQLAGLPPEVARDVPADKIKGGKVPAAHFLEQAGAKGMRNGDIQVAGYHANLIFNHGGGTATQLRGLITALKAKVRAEFGIELEEEVQYVGRF